MTPTDEIVRDAYGEYVEYHQAWTNEWDQWLAAHDARVRAEALRDAAQAFNVEAVYFSSHDRSLSQGQQAAVVDALAESLDWLRARAASIEQETQP